MDTIKPPTYNHVQVGLPADQPCRPLCPRNAATAGAIRHRHLRSSTKGSGQIGDRVCCLTIRQSRHPRKAAGFDMVELHGGTGYQLAELLSTRTNKRDDEYEG